MLIQNGMLHRCEGEEMADEGVNWSAAADRRAYALERVRKRLAWMGAYRAARRAVWDGCLKGRDILAGKTEGEEWAARVYNALGKRLNQLDGFDFPKIARLVMFGLGGHVVEYTNNSKLQGYDRPETWRCEPEEADLFEGCAVVDGRAMFEREPRLAVSLPMADARLFDDECEPCEEVSDVMLAGLGGAFKSLASMTRVEGFRGLDKVSVETWVRLVRERGARVGVVKDGRIEWEG